MEREGQVTLAEFDSRKDGRFSTVEELFSLLNVSGIAYLVMRNHENLLTPDFFLDGHPDIDILCSDSDALARRIGAQTNRKNQHGHYGDGTHFHVFINGRKVSLDLRHTGDGYYCTDWQRDALSRRLFNGSFYVMSDEDYFYTLAYHAILQKPSLTDEYCRRLRTMADSLGVKVDNDSEEGFIHVLQDYMRSKGYTFTYPRDEMVRLRTSMLDRRMIDSDLCLLIRHHLFETKVNVIDFFVRLKHLVRL